MSSIFDLLGQTLGEDAISNIAQQVGTNSQATRSVVEGALPMLVSALAKNASSADGAGALLGALNRDHDGSLLDSLGGLLGGAGGGGGALGGLLGGAGGGGGALGGLLGGLLGGSGSGGGGLADLLGGGAGDAILGHVLGGRRGAAENALSKKSGLSGAQVASILAMLAPIVMGALGKLQRSQNLDAGGLSDLLQGERARVQQKAPEAASFFEQILDRDGDGSMMDDLASTGMSVLGSLLGGRRG